MTISRPLWASQRGSSGSGSGEVVIAASSTETSLPSITATLGYVGAEDDPVVTLDITDPATGADELRVYRDTATIGAAALPSPLDTLTPATVSDDDAAVVIGTTYYYRLGSVTGGLVRLSSEVSVSVVEKPAGPDFSTAAIGDAIGGGIYAGQITYADGRQYHVVAAKQADETNGLQWCTTNENIARDEDDGVANTAAAYATAATFPAFDYCDTLASGGFSDWYLPALNELLLVYNGLVASGHAEFQVDLNSNRVTSTDKSFTTDYVDIVNFSDGSNASYPSKTSTYHVRPIRRIPVNP